jgi:hypothetical protein
MKGIHVMEPLTTTTLSRRQKKLVKLSTKMNPNKSFESSVRKIGAIYIRDLYNNHSIKQIQRYLAIHNESTASGNRSTIEYGGIQATNKTE